MIIYFEYIEIILFTLKLKEFIEFFNSSKKKNYF